jgi:protein SCO1/2
MSWNQSKQIDLPLPPTGGNFTLTSPIGKVSLSDFSGKLVLLYFGFLSCPDVCPTTLSLYTQALKKLDKQTTEKIVFLFINVDPERDTIDALKKYTSFFDSSIIPLTGSLEEIQKVAKQYGVSFIKVPIQSEMKYTIDHTASILLIDSTGKILDYLPHGSNTGQIIDSIQKYSESK